MQDIPVECSIDATEIEQMACKPSEPVKPTKPGGGTVTPQSGGGGTGNPPEPKPNPK